MDKDKIEKAKNKTKDVLNTIGKGYSRAGNAFLDFFDKHVLLICMILITILSLVARYLTVQYPTNDIAGIVFSWMRKIKEVGFSKFYTVENDYTPLYLFFIAVLCQLPTGETITNLGMTYYANWMIYLKSFFFFLDLLSAFGIYLLIRALGKDKTKAAIGFMVYMILPVQYVNTAIWGQCDNMYTVCFIYILYFLVKHKDGWAWFLVGLGFATKLQGVFIFPLMVYLVFSRRVKFYKIYLAFVGLIVTFLPEYFCGAPFGLPFEFISTQLGRFSGLTLGCGNMWHLMNFSSGALEMVSNAATWIGLGLIGVFMAILFVLKIDLKGENLLYVGTFLIAIVPFFLPHMHERYFYALDVLVVVYALVKGKRYFLIPLMQVSSGIAYYHYLSGKYFIQSWGEDSVHISAYINLAVLCVIFYDLLKLKGTAVKADEPQPQQIASVK